MTTFGEKLGGEFLPHWCWNGLKNAKKNRALNLRFLNIEILNIQKN